ncbi:MAG: cation diffusion facilitator family transporter [Spirochaetales bacterium]
MNEANDRRLSRSGWISILVNVLLFALKYWAGLVTGSVALTADAWHTLSDSASSIMMLFGARKAKKPADGEHPFGHGRADLIVGIAIGTVVGWIGISFLVESLERIGSDNLVEYGAIGVVVTILSLLGKEAIAQFAFLMARKSNSASLRADAWHHRSDALSSLVILVGIVFAGSWPYTDAILGFTVAGFLFYAAWDTVRSCSMPLLGESPSRRSLEQVRGIARETSPELDHVHHVHVHRYGDHTELTCHVHVDGTKSVNEAHDLVDEFEQALRDRMGVEPTVHVDPDDEPERK